MARRKVGGSHLSVYVFDQLPVISPNKYKSKIQMYVGEKAFKLTYTCNDLKPLANEYGYEGEPYTWNEEESFQLKCELDAIFGRLYGISREEFDYILETFPIVKRKDMNKYGTYRTKDNILKLFDEMDWVQEEIEKNKNLFP